MNRREIEKALVDNFDHFQTWKMVKFAVDYYSKHPAELEAELQAARVVKDAKPRVPQEERVADRQKGQAGLDVVGRAQANIRSSLAAGMSVEQVQERTRLDANEVTNAEEVPEVEWKGRLYKIVRQPYLPPPLPESSPWSEDTIYRNSKERKFMARPIGYAPKKM